MLMRGRQDVKRVTNYDIRVSRFSENVEFMMTFTYINREIEKIDTGAADFRRVN